MRISVAGTFGDSPRRDFGFVREFAQTLEALGFHALSVPEHVVFFARYDSRYPYTVDGSAAWGPDTGLYDPLAIVQAAAGATTTLRFHTGILILPQRPVLLTAKDVMSLDHATDGRFELGVGAGWSWEEYAALGVPFEGRGRRLDEYIDVLRLVWREDRPSFAGEFVQFDEVVLNPKPLTPGGPPIIIGGDSAPAFRRAAGRGDGWFGWWAQHDDAIGDLEPRIERLGAALATAGRSIDDDDFDLKVGLPLFAESPDVIATRVETARCLGVDELVLAPPIPTSSFGTALEALAGTAGLA